MFQSEKKWDQEWRAGQWDYMDKVAVERSKTAVMGVLVQIHANSTGSVLDIGCGEGSLADFLTPEQKHNYVGVDLSKEAVLSGRRKRRGLRFVHAAAHQFHPRQERMHYDTIVFADMLYYVEYEKVLAQYNEYLSPNGVVVVSIWRPQLSGASVVYKNFSIHRKRIFEYVGKIFERVDEMEVSGTTKKKANEKNVVQAKVVFDIIVYRKRNESSLGLQPLQL